MDVPVFYLDLQLSLDSLYPKNTLKYTNKKLEQDKIAPIEARVDWYNVLRGKALDKYQNAIFKMPKHIKDRFSRK